MSRLERNIKNILFYRFKFVYYWNIDLQEGDMSTFPNLIGRQKNFFMTYALLKVDLSSSSKSVFIYKKEKNIFVNDYELRYFL